jgi:cysteine desulfurase/selenocysteine lyase
MTIGKNRDATAPLDVDSIRQEFPVLSRTVNGKPLVYLDNAATSQKPRVVIRALTDYYENYNSNVHRGVHTLSMEATEKYEEARTKVARFINSPSSEQIIWTRNTTESINLVAQTWAIANLDRGDEILLTEMEHHSNLVPWQQVALKTGASLRFIPMAEDFTLDLSDLDRLLTSKTRLMALTTMSNVLGTITPAKELVAAAHRVGAVVLLDAAQSVPHMPTDVQDLGCDFMAFSAHKMCGPTGIGVLYASKALLDEMEPFFTGGEMVKEVWLDRASWADLPMRFEAGTPNIADAIAMGAAVDYLSGLGMDRVRQHEVQLTRYALERFQEMEEVVTYGTPDLAQRGGVVSFYASDIHPHDIGTVLDQLGVAIRAGHHCAMPLMRKLEVPATGRASFYIYNKEEEIDALVDGLKGAMRFFGNANRRA